MAKGIHNYTVAEAQNLQLGQNGAVIIDGTDEITGPFIAITALSRFIILQGKSINPEILVYEAGAILLIALAILVLRFRNSPIVGLDKKKKNSKK